MKLTVLGAALLLAAALPVAGQAQVGSTIVLGGGFAEGCSRAALDLVRANERRGDRMGPPVDAIALCNRALSEESLDRRDQAATHVNRGVLEMNARTFAAARADFARAVDLKPDLAEAHVNLGGALIALGDYRAGVVAIDRGLDLQTEEPEKAYFNRAMARERLDDIKGAYFDFLKASELKPDWEAPRTQMQRFTVTPQP